MPNPYNPRKPHRESTAMPLAWLQQIKRNLQNDIRLDREVAPLLPDCSLQKMLRELRDLHIRQTSVSLPDRFQLSALFVPHREGVIAQHRPAFPVSVFRR